jgi:hypothetical protein
MCSLTKSFMLIFTFFAYEPLMRTATHLTKVQMQVQNTVRNGFFHQCHRQSPQRHLPNRTRKEGRTKEGK